MPPYMSKVLSDEADEADGADEVEPHALREKMRHRRRALEDAWHEVGYDNVD